MITLAAFAEQQRVAFESGDVEEALRLLSEIEEPIGAANDWIWLRSNEPENYEQLIGKLEQFKAGRSATGRTEMYQLAKIFRSCRDYGISLVELDTPHNLHKYREAAAMLNAIVSGGSQIGEQLEAAIETIKSHSCRADTRAWARTPRGQ